MLDRSTKLGPYEILGPLGAGGMGEVYRARDTRLGREVAIKVLPEAVAGNPDRISRFEREVRALAALSHPNILAIHDFGHDGEVAYAVTELLEGETLGGRLLRDRPSWRKSSEIAAGIAEALAAAHARHIVHRDLKPENVFLTSDGQLKVLDFGLAKFVEPVLPDASTLTSPHSTSEGRLVGTVSYMSPEQARGLHLDERTDIFSLGCVLYEMLSGRRPFDRSTAADTISAILHEEPPTLDDGRSALPPALAQIVSRCLEKSPEDRFHSAHDLALALRSLSGASEPDASRITRKTRGLARRLAAAGGGAAVVAAAAVVAFLLLRHPEEPHGGRSAARQITTLPGWEVDPAVSPDGSLVAFASNASGSADIWLVEAAGGEPRQLTDVGLPSGDAPDDVSPAWLPDGRSLLFSSDRAGKRSVWRTSFLGGSPRLVVEDADTPAVSPDGSLLAFSRPDRPGGDQRIWIAPLADPGKARKLTTDDGGLWDHTHPAFSPDGRTLCYADFRNLWLVDVAGGPARRLTASDAFDAEPCFSPDGSLVYFSSRRQAVLAVWTLPVAGGEARRVTEGAGSEKHPSLSRDGSVLATSTYLRDSDVLVLDRVARTVERVSSTAHDETPVLLPDGSGVLFVSDRTGSTDLWLQPLAQGRASGPLRRLTSFEEGGPATPTISRDGRWIAFFRVLSGQRDIWILPVAGGAARPLAGGPAQDLHPALSPDASRLVFVSSRSGIEHLFTVPLREGVAGGAPRQLTSGDDGDVFPAFSPDGREVAFIRSEDVWIVDADGRTEPRKVTSGARPNHFAWDAGGNALMVAGYFGGRRLILRRVLLTDGRVEAIEPTPELGGEVPSGYLSISSDGRFMAVQVGRLQADVWVRRNDAGKS
jgi:Tol biopolymer transport system component